MLCFLRGLTSHQQLGSFYDLYNSGRIPQAYTRVEPLTFRKITGQLPHIEVFGPGFELIFILVIPMRVFCQHISAVNYVSNK